MVIGKIEWVWEPGRNASGGSLCTRLAIRLARASEYLKPRPPYAFTCGSGRPLSLVLAKMAPLLWLEIHKRLHTPPIPVHLCAQICRQGRRSEAGCIIVLVSLLLVSNSLSLSKKALRISNLCLLKTPNASKSLEFWSGQP